MIRNISSQPVFGARPVFGASQASFDSYMAVPGNGQNVEELTTALKALLKTEKLEAEAKNIKALTSTLTLDCTPKVVELLQQRLGATVEPNGDLQEFKK